MEHPPNGQGATAILMNNILAQFDLSALDPFGSMRTHLEAEAAKLINESVKKYGATQIEIKKLEATVSIAHLLARNPSISFIPSGLAGNLLNLNV